VRPRFLADEDLKRAIRDGVVRLEPAVDFLSAESAGMRGLADPQVLSLAAREGRILISHDFESMPGHFWHFCSRQSSPGVFLVAQAAPVSVAIESIMEIWAASEAVEWANQLTYLPL
jgi:hypothetical protein